MHTVMQQQLGPPPSIRQSLCHRILRYTKNKGTTPAAAHASSSRAVGERSAQALMRGAMRPATSANSLEKNSTCSTGADEASLTDWEEAHASGVRMVLATGCQGLSLSLSVSWLLAQGERLSAGWFLAS